MINDTITIRPMVPLSSVIGGVVGSAPDVTVDVDKQNALQSVCHPGRSTVTNGHHRIQSVGQCMGQVGEERKVRITIRTQTKEEGGQKHV